MYSTALLLYAAAVQAASSTQQQTAQQAIAIEKLVGPQQASRAACYLHMCGLAGADCLSFCFNF